MKRRIKKVAVMTATVVVVLGSGNPRTAHAPGPSPAPAEPEAVIFPMMEMEHVVKTELPGTVDVSLTFATMPSDGFELQMNPGAPFDVRKDPGGQILRPDASILKAENHSMVPVRLEISEVAKMEDEDTMSNETFPGEPEQNFRLVDKTSAVKDYGGAILALGRAGMTYENEADFEQCAIYLGKSGTRITDLKAGESAGLQLYGKAMADFYGEYRFTVKPTLKISAVRASQARLARIEARDKKGCRRKEGMRKGKKQMMALIPAMGMTVAGSITGYAELVVEPSDAVTNGTQAANDGGDSASELTGQIDATPSSVTLPLRAGFSVDPTTYTESSITIQAGEKQLKEYKIINNSAVPIYVYISAVGVNKDKDGNPYTGGVMDMSLITTKEDLATAHNVTLATKDVTVSVAGAKPDTGDTGFWLEEKMVADSYEYMLNSSKGKIDAKPGVNGTMMNLEAYGLIQTGWNHQDKFTVTLTFMVITAAPWISQEI